jgi:hypothetical protein
MSVKSPRQRALRIAALACADVKHVAGTAGRELDKKQFVELIIEKLEG